MLSTLFRWSSGESDKEGLNSRNYITVVPRVQNETVFSINSTTYTVKKRHPLDMSLNTFIRDVANLKGTKFMCEEGGCGCCVVTASASNPATGEVRVFAVNSCLTLVRSCHGWSVTTVEGLGSKQKGYHPIQATLAQFNGTQCGYCSPGMVMNMYSLHTAKKNITMQEVEDSFGGNICRCTGYRPILDAFKSLCVDAPQQLRDVCPDIEDTARAQCRGRRGRECTAEMPAHVGRAGASWYRVSSVDDIFHVFRLAGDLACQLVAGHTARGVYPDQAEPQVYIDVRPVAELHAVRVADDCVTFGANITLTEFLEYLRDNCAMKGYSYFAPMAEHISLVANVPVRNMASVAGNLIIKHQHNEFYSDLFLLLETVGAILVIRDISGRVINVGPEELLKLDMTRKVIVHFILCPLENYTLKSYKIMPRAQNVHAIVNAGFLMKLGCDGSQQLLDKPRIVYGGISPKFVHASSTEEYLRNKDLSQQKTVSRAVSSLGAELQPEDNPPEMGPAFRKGLAQSLFYKCVLSLVGDKARKEFRSGGQVLKRSLSSGKQQYQTTPSDYPVGKPISKLEALPQCSGEAEYVNDRHALPGELHAAFVLTSVPNGSIVSISTTEALKVSDVVAFYSAKDIPGRNNAIPNPTLITFENEELFCSGAVLYHGQPVGVIVAKTRRAAIRAKELVKIDYKDVTKPIIHVREALPQQDQRVGTASTSTPITGATHVVEGKFDMGSQYHYHMETQTCCVVPTENGLEVYPSTQWHSLCQVAIAQILDIEENSISVRVRRLGGAFGGKLTRANFVAAACALAAHLLRRPVRMAMAMSDNMAAFGKRDEVAVDYKVGVDDNGKILYLESYLYDNLGSSENENPIFLMVPGFKNCYDSDDWSVIAQKAKTNTPSSIFTRSPGSFNGTASIETIMEHIAKETSTDPVQVRLNNLKSGEPTATFIEAIKQSSDYADRKLQIDSFNKENRWMKKGISLVPMRWNVVFGGSMHCLVSIYAGDGSVDVSHGGIECGQGINTKVAQVVSYTLGIPLGLVAVKPTNSLTAANDFTTGGSVASDSVCFAAIECCKELRRRLQPTAQSMQDPAWTALVSKAAQDGVDLVASQMFSVNEGSPYYVYGACVLEIELDVLTGRFQIARADILEDAGKSISPNVDIGQIEGAFVMGLGLCTSEEIEYDEDTGRLLTNRSWNYWPPGAKDIPVDFRVEMQKNMPNPVGVLRSKTTGEPAVCLSTALIFALRNAIESARRDSGGDGGWFGLRIPLTTERIWDYCLNNTSQFRIQ
ncbi:uncharacterized protein LOC134527771 isoform X3 [Bacillus rossius redtenbacheri]|uniref:uncharacterized protein LOC134527771 isoform X3 n=1 Tax=Bacillus rossius redtenbacheri TaxID=93214 RepID=UPI002FDD3351